MSKLPTELEKAITEGYCVVFIFNEGIIHQQDNPEIKYHITEVAQKPYPCHLSHVIVYRVETKDNIKGTFIMDLFNDEETLHAWHLTI